MYCLRKSAAVMAPPHRDPAPQLLARRARGLRARTQRSKGAYNVAVVCVHKVCTLNPKRGCTQSGATVSSQRVHGTPSHVHGTPSHTHGTPSHIHGTPSHIHGTITHTHGMPAHADASYLFRSSCRVAPLVQVLGFRVPLLMQGCTPCP
eukprot:365209-Chlamydomonas_euryale.AAC.2